MRKEAMANARSQNNSRQIRKNTISTYSNCVDAAIGADNIVTLFVNSHNEISNLCINTIYYIDKYCIKHENYIIFDYTHNISTDDVRQAIKHLK